MTTYAVRVGGLGNQLFQLAAAMAIDPDGDAKLVPGLPNHQTAIEELAPALVRPLDDDDRRRIAELSDDLHHRQPLSDLPAAFVPRPEFVHRPALLKGYFQHPDWYTDSLSTVVAGLLAAAPADIADRVLAAGGQALISVRGSDYVALDRHLAHSYYIAAMKALRPDSATIVSEDLERAELVAGVLSVTGWNVVRPVATGAVEDFWALVAAPAVIMANSTFCWWATQVGDELYRRLGRSRTVVAPASWIRGHGRELVEPRWTAIE